MLEIKRLHWKYTEIYKNILGYRNNIFLDILSKKNITDNETKFSLREMQRGWTDQDSAQSCSGLIAINLTETKEVKRGLRVVQ